MFFGLTEHNNLVTRSKVFVCDFIKLFKEKALLQKNIDFSYQRL